MTVVHLGSTATYSLEGRALDLLDVLVDRPRTQRECCEQLNLTAGQFRSAVAFLRDFVCPQLDVAIPHPVPDDGWRYHVTGDWVGADGAPAIEAGTSYALAVIEARLRGVFRDVQIALKSIDPNDATGEKARFLRHHLDHILRTLVEIGRRHGEG